MLQPVFRSTLGFWRHHATVNVGRLTTLVSTASEDEQRGETSFSQAPSAPALSSARRFFTGHTTTRSTSRWQRTPGLSIGTPLHLHDPERSFPQARNRSLSTLSTSTMDTLPAVSDAATSATAHFLAASPLEAFSSLPAPTQLSIQAWEILHLGLALPWWVSIPLTTLSLRLLLLPLTLKAKAASANFALWGSAFSTASTALATTQNVGPPVTVRARVRAASTVYRYLRTKHRTPGTVWYIGNTLVQVPLFILMSVGLRRMCDLQWPGLGGEGLLALQDLTHPSIIASTWATPYGVFGLFLPLSILASYTAALQFNAAYRANTGAATALDVLALPYLLAALINPQALLLYWLSNSTFHLGLQALLSKPQAAKALGIPMLLVHTRSDADAADKKAIQAEELRAGAAAEQDPELLLLLAEEQLNSSFPSAAAATFRRALELQPGLTKALEGAALAHSMAQEHEEAAQLYQQAAQQAPPSSAASLHLLAASNFLAAAAPRSSSATSDAVQTASGASDQQQQQAASTTSSSKSSASSSKPAKLYTSRKGAQVAATQSTTKFDLALLEKSRTAASTASTQDPTHPHPHTLLALSHLLAGSSAAAAPHITRALELILAARGEQPAAKATSSSADATANDASAAADKASSSGTSATGSSSSSAAGAEAGGALGASTTSSGTTWAENVVGDTLSVGKKVVAGLEGVAASAGERERMQALVAQVEQLGPH